MLTSGPLSSSAVGAGIPADSGRFSGVWAVVALTAHCALRSSGQNPSPVAFDIGISDSAVRAAIELAIAAQEAVHTFPATLPGVVVVQEVLRDNAAAFRVYGNGVLDIAVDTSQTDMIAIDFLHEVGHFVDWAALPPPHPAGMATHEANLGVELEAWLQSVVTTDSHRRLISMSTRPHPHYARLADGTLVELVDNTAYVSYLLQIEELFARSYCQHVAVESGDPELLAQLAEQRLNHYPEQWPDDEFLPIRNSMTALLGTIR